MFSCKEAALLWQPPAEVQWPVYPRVAGRSAPLLRALEGLDAHVDAAHPAASELWLAALAAPLLADAEAPRKRGRPSQQEAELADPGQCP